MHANFYHNRSNGGSGAVNERRDQTLTDGQTIFSKNHIFWVRGAPGAWKTRNLKTEFLPCLATEEVIATKPNLLKKCPINLKGRQHGTQLKNIGKLLPTDCNKRDMLTMLTFRRRKFRHDRCEGQLWRPGQKSCSAHSRTSPVIWNCIPPSSYGDYGGKFGLWPTSCTHSV